MKIIIRLAEPKDTKERLYRVEATVNDLKDPGEAYVFINGREYLVEVHHDFPRRPPRGGEISPSFFSGDI